MAAPVKYGTRRARIQIAALDGQAFVIVPGRLTLDQV
jgi:hypothetical protein